MNNLKQFRELIKAYEEITKEDIEKTAKLIPFDEYSVFYAFDIAKRLTGFGSTHTCTLCKEVLGQCTACTWYHINWYVVEGYRELRDDNFPCLYDESYHAIYDAEIADQLLLAFKQRAEYMKNKLKEYEERRD